MNFNFKSLNKPDDSDSAEEIERRLANYDAMSEAANRGEAATKTSTPVFAGTETKDASDALPTSTDKDKAKNSDAAADPEAAAKKEDADLLEELLRLTTGQDGVDETLASIGVTGSKEKALFENAASSDEADLMALVAQGAKQNPTPVVAAPAVDADVHTVAASGMTTVSPTATTIGNLVGRAVASAAATPFIALSSAKRHLSQRFANPVPAAPAGIIPAAPATAAYSLQASASSGLPTEVAHTLEAITSWKCERIEKSALDVQHAAAAIMNTEAFAVWEDKLRSKANEIGKTPSQMVAALVEDWGRGDDSAGLKAGMDAIWASAPNEVQKYRTSCNDFERNIRNVIKEFVNSDDKIKERVTNAMKSVEEKTQTLPGYTENMGEYFRTMADRIRAMVKEIYEFVSALMAKVERKSTHSELAP